MHSTSFICFKSIETVSLKAVDKESLTQGLGIDLLKVLHVIHSCSTFMIISANPSSNLFALETRSISLRELAWANCLCSFVAFL